MKKYIKLFIFVGTTIIVICVSLTAIMNLARLRVENYAVMILRNQYIVDFVVNNTNIDLFDSEFEIFVTSIDGNVRKCVTGSICCDGEYENITVNDW